MEGDELLGTHEDEYADWKFQKAHDKEVNYSWALDHRELKSGDVITIERYGYGKLKLGVSGPGNDGFRACFEYPPESYGLAWAAFHIWEGQGDPMDGWDRAYPPTFRRRPHLLPDEEYVEA